MSFPQGSGDEEEGGGSAAAHRHAVLSLGEERSERAAAEENPRTPEVDVRATNTGVGHMASSSGFFVVRQELQQQQQRQTGEGENEEEGEERRTRRSSSSSSSRGHARAPRHDHLPNSSSTTVQSSDSSQRRDGSDVSALEGGEAERTRAGEEEAGEEEEDPGMLQNIFSGPRSCFSTGLQVLRRNHLLVLYCFGAFILVRMWFFAFARKDSKLISFCAFIMVRANNASWYSSRTALFVFKTAA